MASSSHSRRKSKLAPITLEELAQDASMTGMVSYLQRPPTEPPLPGMAPPEAPPLPGPAVDTPPAGESHTLSDTPPLCEPHTESELHTLCDPHTLSDSHTLGNSQTVAASPPAAVVAEAVASPAAVNSHTLSEPHTLGDSHTVPEVPLTPAPDAATDSHTLSESHTLSASPAGQPRIRPTRTAQDGHSLGEQAVYDALWRAGSAEDADSNSRLVSIGYERLAQLARLHWTNVKKNLRALEHKLAIETVAAENSNERVGRTYRVYGYRPILERRRAAGLVWFRKHRGVELLTDAQANPTLGKSHRVCDSPTLSDPHMAPLCESPTPTLSVSHRPLGIDLERKQESSSSAVVEALRSHAPDVDDLAARTLVAECRRHAPDATEEEIVHFIHAKAGHPGVRRRMGFLLTAVPRCFAGEAFRQFREGQQRGREEQSRREELYRAQARAVLNDSAASDEERQWAREMLGLPGADAL